MLAFSPILLKKKQKQKLNSIVLIGFQLILSPFRVKYLKELALLTASFLSFHPKSTPIRFHPYHSSEIALISCTFSILSLRDLECSQVLVFKALSFLYMLTSMTTKAQSFSKIYMVTILRFVVSDCTFLSCK